MEGQGQMQNFSVVPSELEFTKPVGRLQTGRPYRCKVRMHWPPALPTEPNLQYWVLLIKMEAFLSTLR